MKTAQPSEDEVRAQVEGLLGYQLPDKQWEHFVREGDVGVVLIRQEDVSWLARKIRDLRKRFGDATQTEPPRLQARLRAEVVPSHTGDHYEFSRQDSLCLAVAALAGKDQEVVAFRREVLDNQTLTYALDSSREGVEEWVARQWEAERPQRAAATDLLPELSYIEFMGQSVQTMPVVPGGALDRLRVLGDKVARRYRWQSHAAIAFVLTGDVVPDIDVLTATIQPNPQVPALSRIIVTADPAATPAAVARAYRQARNRIASTRAREMQPKTLFLAAFATERPQREPVKAQMATWNAAAPDPAWQYEPEQAANFVRDRNAARRRLLWPEYQLPEQEETMTYDDLGSQPSADVRNDSGSEDHT